MALKSRDRVSNSSIDGTLSILRIALVTVFHLRIRSSTHVQPAKTDLEDVGIVKRSLPN